jgi:hypothetical protein
MLQRSLENSIPVYLELTSVYKFETIIFRASINKKVLRGRLTTIADP